MEYNYEEYWNVGKQETEEIKKINTTIMDGEKYVVISRLWFELGDGTGLLIEAQVSSKNRIEEGKSPIMFAAYRYQTKHMWEDFDENNDVEYDWDEKIGFDAFHGDDYSLLSLQMLHYGLLTAVELFEIDQKEYNNFVSIFEKIRCRCIFSSMLKDSILNVPLKNKEATPTNTYYFKYANFSNFRTRFVEFNDKNETYEFEKQELISSNWISLLLKQEQEKQERKENEEKALYEQAKKTYFELKDKYEKGEKLL